MPTTTETMTETMNGPTWLDLSDVSNHFRTGSTLRYFGAASRFVAGTLVKRETTVNKNRRPGHAAALFAMADRAVMSVELDFDTKSAKETKISKYYLRLQH